MIVFEKVSALVSLSLSLLFVRNRLDDVSGLSLASYCSPLIYNLDTRCPRATRSFGLPQHRRLK